MTKRRRQRQRGTPEPCHLPCRRRSRRRVRGGMKSQGWEHDLCSCVASPELAEPGGGRLHEGCGLRAGSWDGLDGKGCWQAAKQAGARLWHVSLYSSKSMLKGGGGGDRRGGKPASKVVGIGRLGGQLHGRIWIFPPCIGADPRFEMMPTCRAPILPCSAPAQVPDQQFVGLACLSGQTCRRRAGWASFLAAFGMEGACWMPETAAGHMARGRWPWMVVCRRPRWCRTWTGQPWGHCRRAELARATLCSAYPPLEILGVLLAKQAVARPSSHLGSPSPSPSPSPFPRRPL